MQNVEQDGNIPSASEAQTDWTIVEDGIEQNETTKTYNRRDSQMVTHSSTSRPVQCLCMAERMGCPVLTDLWSYVFVVLVQAI
jgi:hypothetical protein